MMNQLKSRQICFFFIAFIPIIKLFTLPSVLAEICAEDMWLSACLNVFLDGLTVFTLAMVCRKTKTDFYGLLKLNFGEVVAKIIFGLYFVFFLMKSILPIAEQKDYVEITLYETQPSIFTFLPFFIVSFYLCLKKLRAFGRCADIMWVCSVSGLLVLFALSVGNVDFGAILPVGARGIKNISTGFFRAVTWFCDGAYMLFFVGKFQYKAKDVVKITASYFLSTVCVIVFMIFFYGIFTSISKRQLYALPEMSKYTTVINNIGRFDYIGIILVLFSGVFSLSAPLYFATYCLKKIFGFKKSVIPSAIVNAVVFAIFLFVTEKFANIRDFITNYGSVYFILLGNVVPLLLPLLLIKQKGESYESA